MTSIANTDVSPPRDLSLRDEPAPDTAEPRSSRNFNLRAYIAGGAATTSLIAGAVLVFASLATYVAFNGFPVGGGGDSASRVTVAAQGSTAPEAAAAALGRAPGAVAATAATASATAPASAGADAQGGGGGATTAPGTTVPSTPGAPGDDPAAPGTPTTPVDTATTPTAGASGGGGQNTGPVGGAVDDVSGATNVPLGEAAGGAVQQVDEILGGVSGAGQHSGGGLGGAVQGATGLVSP